MKALTTSEFNQMFLDATDALNLGHRGVFGGDALVAYKNGYIRLIEANDGSSRLSLYYGLANMCGVDNWFASYAKLKAGEKKKFVEHIKTREYEIIVVHSFHGEYKCLQEVGADEISANAHGFQVDGIVSRTKVDIF